MLRRLIRKSKDGLTRLLWRRAGVLLGDGVSFYGGMPRLNVSGALLVGEAVTFKGGRLRSYLDVRRGAELKIGPRTFLNGGGEIQATTSITLESWIITSSEMR